MISEHTRKEIDILLWSIRLEFIRRYDKQRFWETESTAASYASLIEDGIPLENVAAHSWHVADTVLLLGPHFTDIDISRCVQIAILHDKMEIVIGDHNPVGRNGTGSRTHAFNSVKRTAKDNDEKRAILEYVGNLPEPARSIQRALLMEACEGFTREAKFVKAIDKLQGFAYVFLKKNGHFTDQHLKFTLRFTEKAVHYFPELKGHYCELKERFLRQVARRRQTTVPRLLDAINDSQMSLPI